MPIPTNKRHIQTIEEIVESYNSRKAGMRELLVAFYRDPDQLSGYALAAWLEENPNNPHLWASIHHRIRQASDKKTLSVLRFLELRQKKGNQVKKFFLYVKGWLAEWDAMEGPHYNSVWMKLKSNRWNYARFFKFKENLLILAEYVEQLTEKKCAVELLRTQLTKAPNFFSKLIQ